MRVLEASLDWNATSNTQTAPAHGGDDHSVNLPVLQVDSNPEPAQENPRTWTVDKVQQWLVSKDFDQELQEMFRSNDIDGNTLLDLTEEMLRDSLGIKSLGLRMKLLRDIRVLKPPEEHNISVFDGHEVVVLGKRKAPTTLKPPSKRVPAASRKYLAAFASSQEREADKQPKKLTCLKMAGTYEYAKYYNRTFPELARDKGKWTLVEETPAAWSFSVPVYTPLSNGSFVKEIIDTRWNLEKDKRKLEEKKLKKEEKAAKKLMKKAEAVMKKVQDKGKKAAAKTQPDYSGSPNVDGSPSQAIPSPQAQPQPAVTGHHTFALTQVHPMASPLPSHPAPMPSTMFAGFSSTLSSIPTHYRPPPPLSMYVGSRPMNPMQARPPQHHDPYQR
eukprot:Colp12_sorted_trinity150504_noHs@10105